MLPRELLRDFAAVPSGILNVGFGLRSDNVVFSLRANL